VSPPLKSSLGPLFEVHKLVKELTVYQKGQFWSFLRRLKSKMFPAPPESPQTPWLKALSLDHAGTKLPFPIPIVAHDSQSHPNDPFWFFCRLWTFYLNTFTWCRFTCVTCLWRHTGENDGSMDQLTFETLISTTLLSRYMSVLMQYRRVVVVGPSGTGKTHLALALASSLIRRYEYEYQ